jgi:hypothetical protein
LTPWPCGFGKPAWTRVAHSNDQQSSIYVGKSRDIFSNCSSKSLFVIGNPAILEFNVESLTLDIDQFAQVRILQLAAHENFLEHLLGYVCPHFDPLRRTSGAGSAIAISAKPGK